MRKTFWQTFDRGFYHVCGQVHVDSLPKRPAVPKDVAQ